jgi:tRNA(Arg) A34 adenosine deaminase TadA
MARRNSDCAHVGGVHVDIFGGASARDVKVWRTLYATACDLAPTSNARIAAAVVRRGEIISLGHNRLKSHPFQLRFGRNNESIYWHAETAAIHSAYKRTPHLLDGASLYVLRVKRPSSAAKHWILGNAKPCAGCSTAIQMFGIHHVHYTTDEGVC